MSCPAGFRRLSWTLLCRSAFPGRRVCVRKRGRRIMENRLAWAKVAIPAISLLLFVPAAHAVIKALTPLRAFLSDSQFIVIAKVEKLLPDRPGMILAVAEDLKGKAPFRKLAINLKGDTDAQKQKESEQLFKRLAPDLPLVLFVNHRGKRF